MPLSDEDAAALIAEVERAKRELERTRRELEREKSKLEREKSKLERLKWEKGLLKREDEAELEWLQSKNVEIPMFSLLEGPQQSARTAVALAAGAPAVEAMTNTRVFPDTVIPDASVATAARKLGSVAGISSEICRERGASNHPFNPGTVLPLAVRYHSSSWPKHNNNSNSNSNGSNNSSSNDTTSNYGPWWDTTCVVALLRPFDPGKGCQRDAMRGRAVLGVNFSFDRGKSWGRMQHGG